VADRIERWKWRIADRINQLFHRRQCWADLVSWVLDSERIRDTGVRAALPWRPITETCRKDAIACGRCYCGKLGSDGVVLRANEKVCVTRMPGRDADRLCSRPDGHAGMHRCGGVEWSRA
jgi:hypothetical protein